MTCSKVVELALALGVIANASCSVLAQSIRREYWLGIPGNSVSDLLNAPGYPNTPAGVDFRSSFEAPTDWAEEYGTRMRGYVKPPTTGQYTFWIASDDNSQLYLSTDDTVSNKRLIGSVNGWTGSRQWTVEPTQQSVSITLQAGQQYYIEALQKEGGGGDNLAVGWRLPSGVLERPIPGSRLAPYQSLTTPPSIRSEPADLNLAEGEPATFRVSATGQEPLYFQWQRDARDLVGETSATYLLTRAALADNGARFRCIVSNDLGTATSREAVLEVHPETIPPTLVARHPPASSTVRALSQIEITFSEAVTGLDASDLLIDGQAAASVAGVGAGPYVFGFPARPKGTVQISWALGHRITDFTVPPNPFAGADSWTYTVNADAPVADVRINEIVAANASGLADEDGEQEDWIELVNRGSFAVNLGGWALTDDPDQPGQWTFPALLLNPGQHLVLFASGKDRKPTSAGARLHTTFKLNAAGEYLGLYSLDSPRQAVSELAPEFPAQRNDYSYAMDGSNGWRYFRTPTPGAPNGSSAINGILAPPHFSVQRGYFSQPFNLILSASDAGAQIRYTTDGSEPIETSGAAYRDPIPITRTTVVRAAVFKANTLPSPVVTHSYLYGLPTARRSVPALSIVTATNHLLGPTGIIGIKGGTYANGPWQPVNAGDYHNPSKHGIAWERPASAEWIKPQDNSGFQVDCGLRVQGSDWLRPRYTPGSKFSYRLYFRGEYGPGDLAYDWFTNSPVNAFDKVVLRAGHNDDTNPFIKDELVRRLHLDMGQVASRGTFNTLFVNGAYKGYYNVCERIDRAFCQSWHGGGKDWDVIEQFNDVLDGDAIEWNAMRGFITGADMSVPGNYLEAGRRLDLVNFVDYLLVNIYCATLDWPGNNWRAARQRVPGARFRFYVWDAEAALGTWGQPPSQNVLRTQLAEPSEIPTLYRALTNSAEFRLLFADRVHKHMFNGGALVNTNVSARFTQLRAIVSSLIASFDNYVLTTWIPQRRTPMLNHLNAAGLLASSNAPAFNQHGGRVASGFSLTMSAATGSIYYSTNDADPRVPFGGAVAADARLYSGAVLLNRTVTIKARTFNGTNWSALTEATFQVGELGVPLRITEIMYNPPGGEAYEFIELQNVSASTVDLGGVSFDGITFVFPNGAMLGPGARIVLSSDANPAAFEARYPGVEVAGRFGGGLSNGGERIALKDQNGEIIVSVDYNDSSGWPVAADGGGYSLEIVEPNGDPDDPANWRASPQAGGSPGGISPVPPAPTVRLNEIMAENISTIANGGVYPDWVELYNPGATAVNLAAWSLSDDGNPGKFVFPINTTLAAGAYLVVWCDGLTNGPGLHTGFALGRNGESVFLYDPETNRIDAASFGLQLADYTVGRVADGAWRLSVPTPGGTNVEALLESPSNLTINEWMANPPPGADDWFELHNQSADCPVALRGLYVGSSNALHRLNSDSFVAPGGFVVIHADQQPGPDHVDFKLPAAGGMIRLFDETGAEINRVTYTAQSPGISQGRLPDGSASIVSFSTSPSPGTNNYLPVYSGPVLNEIMARNTGSVRDPAGRVADWIELYNPAAGPVDLSGMSLSVGTLEPGEWLFPPGTQLGGGAYLLIWCDASRAASTQAVANLNCGRSLSSEGGGVYLFNPKAQVVDWIEYGFQLDDLTLGRVASGWGLLSAPSPGGTNATAAALGAAGELRLNEWMTNPSRGDDWFEIYNTSTLPVSLSGLYLTDDPSIAGQSKFPVGPLSFIGSGSWVKFIADGDAHQGRDHASFSLDRFGETLRLYNAGFWGFIDSVDIFPLAVGVSQGRFPDGATNFVQFPTTPSPEASNYLPLPNVLINEVLSHTDPPLEDAIELYNPTPAAADISGWYLSNSGNDPRKYRVPTGTIIPAGGYLVLYENGFGGPGSTTPFTFNAAHGESVSLSQVDPNGALTGFRAQVRFGAAANGVSFGRHVTSVGEVHFVPMSRRTFGADDPASVEHFRTGRGRANAYPWVGPVVISEIMYHPMTIIGSSTVENEAEEYVELRNIAGRPVPLYDPAHPTNTWKVGGGIDYTFPTNLSLPSGGYLLLVNFDPATDAAALAAFRAKYGVSPGIPLLGPYGGKLDNDGESVALFKPDPPQLPPHPDAGFVPPVLVEQVTYSVAWPWPTNGGGGGLALQRLSGADYGDDPANWRAAAPTPGAENQESLADRDADRMEDAWESAHGLDPGSAADALLDLDGDGHSNLAEYLSGTDPNDPASRLRIESIMGLAEEALLRFQAVAGRSYTVQYADTLEGGWRKLMDVEPQGETVDLELSDPGQAARTSRYYRLVTPRAP
jgi:hypothetical protein